MYRIGLGLLASNSLTSATQICTQKLVNEDLIFLLHLLLLIIVFVEKYL
jgi:hypothetical protein